MLARATEKINPSLKRRGLLIELASPLSIDNDLFERLKEEFGEEVEIISMPPDFANSNNFFTMLAYMLDKSNQIKALLERGKPVITTHYSTFMLAKGIELNFAGCRNIPEQRAIQALNCYFRSMVCPDAVFQWEFDTNEVISRLINEKLIEKEDDYFDSNIRKHATAMNAAYRSQQPKMSIPVHGTNLEIITAISRYLMLTYACQMSGDKIVYF